MPGRSLITSCWTPPGESGPANSGELIPSFGASLSLAARSRRQPSGGLGVLDADPLDRVHEEASVLESHELAIVELARPAEPEVDRGDRRTRLRQRRGVRRGRDHERRVGRIGARAAQVDGEIVARL